MSLAPMSILVAVALVLTFEGLLYGGSITSNLPALPAFPNFGACTGDPFTIIGCELVNVVSLLGAFGLSIVDAAILILNLASFNIPGAPDYIRLLMTFIIGGAIFLGIAGMLRGYGARST
ncbi:MAG: hypothetical protein ACYDDF_11500 [Thermoplasmatota archaeon]